MLAYETCTTEDLELEVGSCQGEAEMSPQEVRIVPVKVAVTVDENGKPTWTMDGHPPPLAIEALPGKTEIHLELTTKGAYVTEPINWFNAEGHPITKPSSMTIVRDTDAMCKIIDNNPGTKMITYKFRLSVEHAKGVFTSPDPTIINEKGGLSERRRKSADDVGCRTMEN